MKKRKSRARVFGSLVPLVALLCMGLASLPARAPQEGWVTVAEIPARWSHERSSVQIGRYFATEDAIHEIYVLLDRSARHTFTLTVSVGCDVGEKAWGAGVRAVFVLEGGVEIADEDPMGNGTLRSFESPPRADVKLVRGIRLETLGN